jgi:cytochrome c oxidase cbb3-type subunit 1
VSCGNHFNSDSMTWERPIRRFRSARDRASSVGLAIQEHTGRATWIWLYSAIVWLTIVDLFGLILTLEHIGPNLFANIPWLLFSRIRPVPVNGMIFAWLSMMYWGALFYMVPSITGRRQLWNEQLAVRAAATGHTQGREYAEFIWSLEVFPVISWVSNIVNIIMAALAPDK